MQKYYLCHFDPILVSYAQSCMVYALARML